MAEFFAILFLTPLAAVLVFSVAYILGVFLMFVAAAVNEIVVATQHLAHPTGHLGHA